MWNRRSATETEARGTDIVALSDAQLVEGLRSRERDAFEGLHVRYAPGIYNLALRMMRNGQDAEDITQDVLIRAFERVPRDRDVMLKPWLYRMTINRCYDHLRARKRHGGSCPDDQPDLRATGDPFEKAEQGRLFEVALGSLTGRQRAAMILRDVHGFSLPEIGAALDIKTSSVEVLLARGRNAFRSRYTELCREEGLPAPSGIHAVVGLGLLKMLPLPARLQAPLVTAPPALTDGGLLNNLEPAVGAGFGAAIGTSTLGKVAAAILAAATLAGAGEVATHTRTQRPPRPAPVAARVVPAAEAAPDGARASDDGAAAPAPADAGDPAVAPSAEPLAMMTPAPDETPIPDATPSADSTPLAADPIEPTPTPSPSPGDTSTPTPEPSATTSSPSPGASPSPSPSS